MKTVFISEEAYADLDRIFIGLLQWRKVQLDIAFAEQYIDTIVNECYNIQDVSFHFKTVHSSHQRFGNFVHRYRRNKQTLWYIIYNKDEKGNIFINKIISNHITNV